MVVKMMRWPPWPPLSSKKFETTIGLHRLHGLPNLAEFGDVNTLVVEIKWKGQRGVALRRSVKRNFTEGGVVGDDGVVEWNEKFQSVCNLLRCREGLFYPWEIAFTAFKVSKQGLKNKVPVGTASLNLAEFISAAQDEVLDINLSVTVPNTPAKSGPSLSLSLSFTELRTPYDPIELSGRSPPPVSLSPNSISALSAKNDKSSALRAGLRKVKTFKDYVLVQRTKKVASEEESNDGSRSSIKSEDAEYDYPLETDSLDDDKGELKMNEEDLAVGNSFDYEILAHAKCGGACSPSAMDDGLDETWIYYSDHKLGDGWFSVDTTTASVPEKSLRKNPTAKLLSWRKRKLSFKSPKAKKEPLLKKHYGEQGGDDIDFDRRQLSSSDESGFGWHKTTSQSSDTEFGDDIFAVGSWEFKDVISRDGKMKLRTQMFFASIDQRSERAAGESACTALVAIISDWLQSNKDIMPTRSEFDSLIRQGSLEWRNLCENDVYKARFPDKHFDLETILQAEICSLSAVSENSFVGFFHPEELDGGEFNFLQDVMSFDRIWEEITSHKSEPSVYIVSWNDHFFVLKVEEDAYYIIDTLGERLYEGCNQAYILKFDKDTAIYQLQNDTITSDKHLHDKVPKSSSKSKETCERSLPGCPRRQKKFVEEVVYRGRESCKEYIKSFLAAIPIRELKADVKKGLMASTPIHQRLQIEFHYTQLLQSVPGYSVKPLMDHTPIKAVELQAA